MRSISKKLLHHMKNLKENEAHYTQIGVGGFFADILPQDLFPFGIPNDIEEVIELIGNELFSPLYPVAMEFFFSNEYPNPETGELWNFIDSFLEKKEKVLSSEEKLYCRSLRNSYMSIYEVIDIELGKSLTLRDMIEKNSKPFKVQENKGTYDCHKWDILGARIIKSDSSLALAGGVLILNKSIIDEIIDRIKEIHDIMLKDLKKYKNKYSEYMNPELSMKKMWVKEIAEGWLYFYMSKKINKKIASFLNVDGEKIKLCTLEFPLKINTQKMSKILSTFKDLMQDNEKNTWVWVKNLKSHSNKNTKNRGSGREKIFDTRIQSTSDSSIYSVYATVSLRSRKLLIEVNSEQRANILEDFFKTELKDLVGECKISITDLHEASVDHGEYLDQSNSSFLDEEKADFMKSFFDEHYKTWLESATDLLEGETPLQASKTKEGRKKVISLVKGHENAHSKLEKGFPPHLKYDFKWIYKKLGIKKSDLEEK